MEHREGGFIVLHRRVQSWPLWRAMTGQQRAVFVQILLAANWKPSQVWVGREVVQIPRGAFIDSQEQIALDSGTTRKVVRTTMDMLSSEGFLNRVVVGHSKGHGVILTTIVNYSKYQDVSEEEGHGEGHQRATEGPRSGHGGAVSEPYEPVEQVEPPKTLAPSPTDSTPVVHSFACSGSRPTYDVHQSQVDSWTTAFPGVSVAQELRKMTAWLDANPTRRKTHRGIPRFVVSWLERSQNRPGLPGLSPKATTNVNAPAGIGTQWGGPPPFGR